ncbi:AAA family ATPase [Paenibacillus sp. FSL W7-1287]|uniref:AAA family ATPase n=1 Tax=Paenibacillus sp. FSL W7-1287 TaxID=2954538 RepID=UPI0030F65807
MIIMINGAVGSGKTSVAYMLQPMLEKSIIFDPEEIGCMLKRIIPDHVRLKEEQTGDYQDMELWGILTVKTAREMIERYNTDLIIPTTIYKPEIFEFIVKELKAIDPELYHFCLEASESTIYQRLKKRGDELNEYTYTQTLKYTEAFKNHRFEQFIQTDDKDTDDIVSVIMNQLPVYQQLQ